LPDLAWDSGTSYLEEGDAGLRGYLMTLIRYVGFTVAALVGFAIQANAGTPCPELERLRSDVTAVSKQLMRDPLSIRCLSYHRLANAVQAIVEHARKNHEACGISVESLEQMERYRRLVARDSDKLCEERARVLFPR
jgi:hypothetical protein